MTTYILIFHVFSSFRCLGQDRNCHRKPLVLHAKPLVRTTGQVKLKCPQSLIQIWSKNNASPTYGKKKEKAWGAVKQRYFILSLKNRLLTKM